MNIFKDVDISHDSIHPNLKAYIRIDRDGEVIEDLKIVNKGTTNQKQGWDAVSLLQIRKAHEGEGNQDHKRYTDKALENALSLLVQEKLQGQGLREQLSSNYTSKSLFFRLLLYREAHLLSKLLPENKRVQDVLNETITWLRIFRTLSLSFCSANGVVHQPGIRSKRKPEEYPHGPTMLLHLWGNPCREPKLREIFNDLSHPAWEQNQDKLACFRFLSSDLGEHLERLTRKPLMGRVMFPVGVKHFSNGRMHAIMPQIAARPDKFGPSRSNIIWEIETDKHGNVNKRVWEREKIGPAGEMFIHPEHKQIPNDYLVFGPHIEYEEEKEMTTEEKIDAIFRIFVLREDRNDVLASFNLNQ